ncbi:hypothetical protein BBO99_00009866 [Phytophthora kernoviae]|uniref:RxLR effector protein n=1 Tax=Phytophthora kernoviae TaxID=325452 RepID=A0A3R7N9K5_9STRA|nr:hypothetical protein JM18_009764 [Phytophthora kernoviae]KAG2502584.1 hypothetical protein JM18_009852 [Phytophthora kernoviae]RLN45851.1 hypothetical protein BBI17_009965 [Phytophthora kernoviae]RLN72210.1 hypothetical protein BBO99_00009866 [Phytophthora kernoviae]
MRPSFVLLLALALLVAFSNAASATTRMTAVSIADSNKRSLRAVQKEDDDDDDDEEERGVRIDNLLGGIDAIKLSFRSAKDMVTINRLEAAAAGNGAKAVKAAEKLKMMELKVDIARNRVMSAKAVKKEARMFKSLLDAKVAPDDVYLALGLSILNNRAIKTNADKIYKRIRL